jgi:hypothetical protein
MFCHVLLLPSVGQQSNWDKYLYCITEQKGVPCLTIKENKKQLTMPYGGRNCKWHSLQVDILKNGDE